MADYVQNDETLYRCVFHGRNGYELSDSGELIVTRSAFLDPNNQPSIDRAKLCSNDPRYAQHNDERNGVVSLVAEEVRGIGEIKQGGNPQITHEVDVVPDPLADNPAHAEIRANPRITSDKVYRRLKTSLALLANKRGWLIRPEGYRDD